MAATNFTPIQLYYSTTASAAPVAANLANGELAINITDGKLFYKDNGGTVQVLATKATGTIGGSNTQVQYNSSGALAGSANFTFNGTTATINTLNLTNALGTTYGGTGLNSYTTGDIVYASASNTLSKLTIGTNGYILTSNGSIPTWTAGSSISVNTADNLSGGAAGSLPYQSGAGATTFLSIGTANRVLTSSGTAPQWVTSLTGLTGVSSSGLTNTSLTSGRVVYSTTGGAQTDSANLTFNGTTLTAGGFATGGSSTLDKLVKIGDSAFNLPAVLSATAPAKLYVSTATVTDASSGAGATNTLGTIASLGSTTVAASNTGVTYTNLATLYIAGAPTAGTNITITNPYAFYVATGNSYLGGNLSAIGNVGVGTANTSDVMLRIGGTPSVGGGSTYGFLNNPTYSGTATSAYGMTNATVLAAGSTISNSYGVLATTGSWGAGATVTNQYGFLAASTLTGATNNYGVASDIPAGVNRWNFYASGDAANYFAGSTTIGASSSYTLSLNARLNTNLQFAADGSYNIGGSTNYRPAYVYVASQVNVGSALNASGYGVDSGSPIRGTTSFSTYTPDGLYGATANPSRFTTPGTGSAHLIGYYDAAAGQYWPRYGFLNGSACSVQAKNSIGNDNNGDFWIGTGTGNTEALRILASDQSVHVGGPYSTTGVSGNYLTAQSIGLGNQSGDNAYLRRQTSGIYAWQTAIGGTSAGSIELQPYSGYVGIGTGGSGSSYPLEIYYSNNAIGYGEKVSSSTDYNGFVLGAANSYGSNNSAQDKWYVIWRGRQTGSGHAYRLYDNLNGRDVFNMTPGVSWSLTASSADAGAYLKQVSWGDLGVCVDPTSSPVNPYPGFNFQGGGMVSPQVYDMAIHKNILYNAGWKFTVSSKRGAIMLVQDGQFTWSGTTATGTAGGSASVSDFMILTPNKTLSVGSSTSTSSSGAAISRIYAGTGYGGGGANAIAHDQLGGNGFARTVYFADGISGVYTKIKVQINLQGAGGWCIQLNTGGTGGGAYLIAGGYMNGPANYSFTAHASSGTWANAAVTDNIFYVELQSNVGTHPCITGSITGSLNHNFGQGDITVTFS